MRVLIATYGSRGDVEPVAGLALELRKLGADVRVGAPPDEEFTRRLKTVGAEAVPVGRPVRELLRSRPTDAHATAAAIVDSQHEGLRANAFDCDLLLATGMVPAAAATVAEELGIPYRFASFIPGVLPSPHHPPHRRPGKPFPPDASNEELWAIDAENLNALYGPPLNELRAARGLPPVADIRTHAYTERPILASDPVLGPWREAPDLEVVRTGPWILPDDRPLPADLLAFLDAGDAPVFAGFGSMPIAEPESVSRALVGAARAAGRRLVLSSGWAGLAPIDGESDVFGLDEANHQKLLLRTAAAIHHGGAGTTATAARSGAPQVIVPQLADQPYWAERVVALGIGVAHVGPTPTAESLAVCLDAALDPDTATAAAALAGTLRTDGAAVAARFLLEELDR